ncbi:unknown [Porcine circovirus 2]|uniref:Uncharacterized protein n=1 Tax=Porcine circovirus 2 TaxID=85708 RepID=O56127_PCV2|nr:unknown [Porcine circovirus 2]
MKNKNHYEVIKKTQ